MTRQEAFIEIAELAQKLRNTEFHDAALVVCLAAFGVLTYSEEELAEEARSLRDKWREKAKLAADLNDELGPVDDAFWADDLD